MRFVEADVRNYSLTRLLFKLRHTWDVWTLPGRAGFVRRFVRGFQLVFLTVLCVLILPFWLTPVTREWIKDAVHLDDGTVVATLGIVVALVLLVLDDLFKRINYIADMAERTAPAVSKLIRNGVLEVYTALQLELDSVSLRRERTVEVLGLSLCTAWPNFKAWLELETTRDWKVTLFCLSPEYIANHPDLPSEWADSATNNLKNVRKYISLHDETLRERG
jgi:hypothetical protein